MADRLGLFVFCNATLGKLFATDDDAESGVDNVANYSLQINTGTRLFGWKCQCNLVMLHCKGTLYALQLANTMNVTVLQCCCTVQSVWVERGCGIVTVMK